MLNFINFFLSIKHIYFGILNNISIFKHKTESELPSHIKWLIGCDIYICLWNVIIRSFLYSKFKCLNLKLSTVLLPSNLDILTHHKRKPAVWSKLMWSQTAAFRQLHEIYLLYRGQCYALKTDIANFELPPTNFGHSILFVIEAKIQ